MKSHTSHFRHVRLDSGQPYSQVQSEGKEVARFLVSAAHLPPDQPCTSTACVFRPGPPSILLSVAMFWFFGEEFRPYWIWQGLLSAH